jgi:hypothetical protein
MIRSSVKNIFRLATGNHGNKSGRNFKKETAHSLRRLR